MSHQYHPVLRHNAALLYGPCPLLGLNLTALSVCLLLLAGGRHSQKDSSERCQSQTAPFLCPVGEESLIIRILDQELLSSLDSLPFYHAALQSHKEPENVICPLKDPEDANISEHSLHSGLLS